MLDVAVGRVDGSTECGASCGGRAGEHRGRGAMVDDRHSTLLGIARCGRELLDSANRCELGSMRVLVRCYAPLISRMTLDYAIIAAGELVLRLDGGGVCRAEFRAVLHRGIAGTSLLVACIVSIMSCDMLSSIESDALTQNYILLPHRGHGQRIISLTTKN
jgi:hypothetical protein